MVEMSRRLAEKGGGRLTKLVFSAKLWPLAALKPESSAEENLNKKRQKLKTPRKSRIKTHVTVVRRDLSAVPVRIVKDEFGEDRLQVGDRVVGWPKMNYAYPDFVEYASIEFSDGRSWNLPAETIPFDSYAFAQVRAVSRRTQHIDVLPADDGISYVYVDDVVVGVADRGFVYPRQVTVVKIACGSSSVTVADRDVPVLRIPSNARHSRASGWEIEKFCRYSQKREWRRIPFDAIVVHDQLFVSKTRAVWLHGPGIDFDAAIGTEVGDEFPSSHSVGRLGPDGFGMTFDQAKAMSVGDTVLLEREFAFWMEEDGSVTNGKITFPKERPFGQEWRSHLDIQFAVGVTLDNWPTLLEAIVGCYFESVNTDTRTKARVDRQKEIVRNRERIRRVVAGHCFDPGTFDVSEDVEVGIGDRLLFIGRRGGKRVFAVDSPNHGTALYLFDADGIKAARDWANGRIDWREAQRLATKRIVHVGEWKDRAIAAIS